MEEVNEVLLPGEIVLMTARQSYLSSISPDRIFVTDKRMIEIHHSFWGLYTGHNIFNVTKFNMVGYDSIKGVMIAKGKILSSLKVRSRIAQEAEERSSEWGIDGLRHHEAELMLNLIQDTLQNRGTVPVDKVTLTDAKKLVEKNPLTRFIWLGVQDYRRALTVMQVDPTQISHILPSEINKLSKTDVESLDGSIFVDYNGAVATSMARYLKKEKGVNTYVLKDGLQGIRKSSIEPFKQGREESEGWMVRNAPSISRVAEMMFGLVWIADALVKINTDFYNTVSSMIASGAQIQLPSLQAWVGFWVWLSSINQPAFASIIIGLELLLGVCLLVGLFRKPIYIIGFIYSLMLWSIPEGFGGPYNNPSIVPTDIGTGVIYAFVFVFIAVISAIYGSNRYTLDNLLEKHIGGWERIAEIKD